MAPIVGRSEPLRHADRADNGTRQQRVVIDAAVDDANDRRVVANVVDLRQIGDRQLKRLAGGDIRFRRQIDIGNVASDMTVKMVAGVPQADGSVKPEPRMAMDNVVRTFLTMAQLPPEANILNVTVMAAAMPFVGRG